MTKEKQMGRKKKLRIAPACTSERRRQVIRKWQSGELSPRFARGSAVRLPWPAQQQRADESLAVEDLRRAYYAWKMRRKAR